MWGGEGVGSEDVKGASVIVSLSLEYSWSGSVGARRWEGGGGGGGGGGVRGVGEQAPQAWLCILCQPTICPLPHSSWLWGDKWVMDIY